VERKIFKDSFFLKKTDGNQDCLKQVEDYWMTFYNIYLLALVLKCLPIFVPNNSAFYYLCFLVIGIAAWLVDKYLRCHQLVLVGLFTVLVCVLEVQTRKR